MKKKFYAVYIIDDAASFKLRLMQSGFATKEEAESCVNIYSVGAFVIIEYYE
jgi:hypothetical protein